MGVGFVAQSRAAFRIAALVFLAFVSACAHAPRMTGQELFPAPPVPADEAMPDSMPPSVADVHPRIVASGNPLQCVPYAREQTGIEIFGNANRWWREAEGKYRRSRTPATGTVMVFNGSQEDPRGHVAVVRVVKDSRTLIVDHANWYGHGEITLSNPVVDISPKNDWSRVKVWWIPGEQWGARTFSIAGFIYPEHEIANAGGVTGSVSRPPVPRRRVTADSNLANSPDDSAND